MSYKPYPYIGPIDPDFPSDLGDLTTDDTLTWDGSEWDFFTTSGGPFPILTWQCAVFADDPLWTPPADGGAVSSWRDGSGNGRNLTQATGGSRPTYRAAGIATGRASVQGDGGDHLAASFTGSSQPVSIVVIGKSPSSGCCLAVAGGSNAPFVGVNGTSNWRLFSGGSQPTFGTYTTSPVLVGGVINGASSKGIENDSVTTGLSTGTTASNGFALFSRPEGDSWNSGHIGFAGLYNGDITADAGWPDFLAWASAYYSLGF